MWFKHTKRVRSYEDDEEYEDDDESVNLPFSEVGGPVFLPSFTGLLKADGSPYLKHPIAVRMGFHPERNKYYCPTLEDDDIPSSGAVVGWHYGDE